MDDCKLFIYINNIKVIVELKKFILFTLVTMYIESIIYKLLYTG